MTEDGPDPTTWLTTKDARELVDRYCGSEVDAEVILVRGVHIQRVPGPIPERPRLAQSAGLGP
jgi:hypothetical protein